jgi:hypothetical protein
MPGKGISRSLEKELPERYRVGNIYGALRAIHEANTTKPAFLFIFYPGHFDLFIPNENIHGAYLVALLATFAVMIVYLHIHAISPSRIPVSALAYFLTQITPFHLPFSEK